MKRKDFIFCRKTCILHGHMRQKERTETKAIGGDNLAFDKHGASIRRAGKFMRGQTRKKKEKKKRMNPPWAKAGTLSIPPFGALAAAAAKRRAENASTISGNEKA